MTHNNVKSNYLQPQNQKEEKNFANQSFRTSSHVWCCYGDHAIAANADSHTLEY